MVVELMLLTAQPDCVPMAGLAVRAEDVNIPGEARWIIQALAMPAGEQSPVCMTLVRAPSAPCWREAMQTRGLRRGWICSERSAATDIANCCASLPGWHRASRTRLDGGAPSASLLYVRCANQSLRFDEDAVFFSAFARPVLFPFTTPELNRLRCCLSCY